MVRRGQDPVREQRSFQRGNGQENRKMRVQREEASSSGLGRGRGQEGLRSVRERRSLQRGNSQENRGVGCSDKSLKISKIQ